jgi:hypothetical protein
MEMTPHRGDRAGGQGLGRVGKGTRVHGWMRLCQVGVPSVSLLVEMKVCNKSFVSGYH